MKRKSFLKIGGLGVFDFKILKPVMIKSLVEHLKKVDIKNLIIHYKNIESFKISNLQQLLFINNQTRFASFISR